MHLLNRRGEKLEGVVVFLEATPDLLNKPKALPALQAWHRCGRHGSPGFFQEQRTPRSQGPAPSRKPWARGQRPLPPCAPTQGAAGKEGAADASFAFTAAPLGSQFCAKMQGAVCSAKSDSTLPRAPRVPSWCPCSGAYLSPPGVQEAPSASSFVLGTEPGYPGYGVTAGGQVSRALRAVQAGILPTLPR